MSGAGRFSVVIPVHNRCTTVEGSVRAVLAQRTVDVEVVVVDDGSTDGSADVVDAIAADDDRVVALRQPNAGVSAARNQGARRATGDVLAFLDADDTAEPEWLARFAELLQPGVDVAFGAARMTWPDGTTRVTAPTPMGAAFGDRRGQWVPGCVALRRSLFLDVGGFAVALRYSENTELGLRVCAALDERGTATDAHDDPLYVWNMPEGAWTNAWSDLARLESALYIVAEHHEALGRDPRVLGSYEAIAGVAAARLDRGRDARRQFLRAARADPRDPRHLARWALATAGPLRRRRWPPRDERGPRFAG